jgi:hypothetical protein
VSVTRDFLPIVVADEIPQAVEWLDFSGVSITDPFFFQTVDRIRRTWPDRQIARENVEHMIDLGEALGWIQPAGFIFHISRCGSTLIANSLRCAEATRVLSEPQPFGSMCNRLASETERSGASASASAIKALSAVYSLHAATKPQRLLVKFPASNILAMGSTVELFPQVPRLIVVRSPIEVAVSNLNEPSGWMRKIDRDLAHGIQESDSLGRVDSCARTIGEFIRSAIAGVAGTMVVDYSELTLAKLLSIFSHFQLEEPPDPDRLRRVFRTSAKDPRQRRVFVNDIYPKMNAASGELRAAIARWAEPAYRELLDRRHPTTR